MLMYVRIARKNIYPLLTKIQVANISRPIMELPGQLQVEHHGDCLGLGGSRAISWNGNRLVEG